MTKGKGQISTIQIDFNPLPCYSPMEDLLDQKRMLFSTYKTVLTDLLNSNLLQPMLPIAAWQINYSAVTVPLIDTYVVNHLITSPLIQFSARSGLQH